MRAAIPGAPLLVTALAPQALAALPANARRCEAAAARTLCSCLQRVTARTRDCYLSSGATCPAGDIGLAAAAAKVGRTLDSSCRDDAGVQAVGWGPLLGVDTLAARVREACLGTSASVNPLWDCTKVFLIYISRPPSPTPMRSSITSTRATSSPRFPACSRSSPVRHHRRAARPSRHRSVDRGRICYRKLIAMCARVRTGADCLGPPLARATGRDCPSGLPVWSPASDPPRRFL